MNRIFWKKATFNIYNLTFFFSCDTALSYECQRAKKSYRSDVDFNNVMTDKRKHAIRNLKWTPEEAEKEFRTYPVNFEPVETACGGRSRNRRSALVKVKRILIINFLHKSFMSF